jgi:hypothetical protein
MPSEKSLLIECPACGIENLLVDIVPGVPAICNQCREALLRPDLIETHTGHSCDFCSMAFILNKETGFEVGDSECQCGSSDFSPLELGLFVADSTTENQDSDEEDGESFDWCRPGPDNASEGDYNNIFDDDPGFSQ